MQITGLPRQFNGAGGLASRPVAKPQVAKREGATHSEDGNASSGNARTCPTTCPESTPE